MNPRTYPPLRRRLPQRLHARAVGATVLITVAMLVCSPAQADWSLDTDAKIHHDDNLTNAQNTIDKRAGTALSAAVAVTWFEPLTTDDAIIVSLRMRGESFDRYPGLSNVLVGSRARYRHKFGTGALAPWAAIALDASFNGFQESLRTSTRLELRAETGRRFDPQLDAAIGASVDRRFDPRGEAVVPGIAGNVFDLAGHGGHVRAGYALSDEIFIDIKAAVRRGDVESTSRRSLPVFLASDAIAPDPVFGDPLLFAYRLHGTTWSAGLAGSYALSNRASLNAGYSHDLTRAAQGVAYASRVISISFAYRL